ncbi:hypothetical protein ACFQZ4_53105 [Catellatospora coxensis]
MCRRRNVKPSSYCWIIARSRANSCRRSMRSNSSRICCSSSI